MVDPRRQLASEAESLRGSSEAPSPTAEPTAPATPELDRSRIVARFGALADATTADDLRADDPHTRVAACWHALLRDQALGTAPPHDGLRLMLLVNLASVQDLELLMILAELDPCATVRGAASTFLWRVARDRDRVVDLLLARLAVERTPAAVLPLLELVPPLPFERTTELLLVHLVSASADVRARARHAWIAAGGDSETLVSTLPVETDAEHRLEALAYCARSDEHARLLVGVTGARERAEVLTALAGARRHYPLAAVAHLLGGDDFDAMLCLVEGPYDELGRARLIELTRVFATDEPTRLPSELARCLAEAHRNLAPTPADRERLARVRALLDDAWARLRSLGGTAALVDQLAPGGSLYELDELDELGAVDCATYDVAIDVAVLDALRAALQGE